MGAHGRDNCPHPTHTQFPPRPCQAAPAAATAAATIWTTRRCWMHSRPRASPSGAWTTSPVAPGRDAQACIMNKGVQAIHPVRLHFVCSFTANKSAMGYQGSPPPSAGSPLQICWFCWAEAAPRYARKYKGVGTKGEYCLGATLHIWPPCLHPNITRQSPPSRPPPSRPLSPSVAAAPRAAGVEGLETNDHCCPDTRCLPIVNCSLGPLCPSLLRCSTPSHYMPLCPT